MIQFSIIKYTLYTYLYELESMNTIHGPWLTYRCFSFVCLSSRNHTATIGRTYNKFNQHKNISTRPVTPIRRTLAKALRIVLSVRVQRKFEQELETLEVLTEGLDLYMDQGHVCVICYLSTLPGAFTITKVI